MALADYMLCSVCNGKVYYDSSVEYHWNTGAIEALCKHCSETHEIIVRKKDNALEGESC